MSDQPAPIIIKRKKVIAAGHHGGAWKVAYADFVTAMMAFFLLMWLLGATTEKQRKGIADYFNPTIPVNKVSGGGDGAFGGDSIFSENSLAQNGTGAGVTIGHICMSPTLAAGCPIFLLPSQFMLFRNKISSIKTPALVCSAASLNHGFCILTVRDCYPLF